MNVIIVVVIVIIIIVVVVVVFVIIIVIVIVIYSVLGPPTYSLNLSNIHAVVPCFPSRLPVDTLTQVCTRKSI